MAVGFQITGYEFPCNPDLIVQNTVSATEEEAARVLRVLRGDLYELSLEVVPDLPEGSEAIRKEYPLRYREFARLTRLY